MSRKYPGAMILAKDSSSMFHTHHIAINGNGEHSDDWLDVYDAGEDVWLTFKNSRIGDKHKTYYHLEMEKGSELWQNIVKAVRLCHINTPKNTVKITGGIDSGVVGDV